MPSNFQELIPMVIPIIILQLILMVVALRDLFKQPSTRGPKWMWALIVPFIQIIGPVLYFVVGRKD